MKVAFLRKHDPCGGELQCLFVLNLPILWVKSSLDTVYSFNLLMPFIHSCSQSTSPDRAECALSLRELPFLPCCLPLSRDCGGV